MKEFFWVWDIEILSTHINSICVGDVDGDEQVEIVTGGYFFDNTRYNGELAIWENA